MDQSNSFTAILLNLEFAVNLGLLSHINQAMELKIHNISLHHPRHVCTVTVNLQCSGELTIVVR